MISSFCIYINIKILDLKLKPLNLNRFQLFSLILLLLILYAIAIRGPFRRVIMNNNNYAISSFKSINDTCVNPLMAFKWALKNYQNQKRIDQISFINPNEAKILENKLFPLFYTSVKNEVAKRLKLNVYINLMESFI